MFAELLAIVVSLEQPVHYVETTPPVTRAFHDALAQNLRVKVDDAATVYSGYLQSRTNIIDAFNVRANIWHLIPSHFQCGSEDDMSSEASMAYLAVVRGAKAHVQDADSHYLRMMIELSDLPAFRIPESRVIETMQHAATSWRLQWLLESDLLPEQHVPVGNVWSQGGGPVRALPADDLDAKYLSAVRPHLIAVERYGLYSHDLTRPLARRIGQARREQDNAGVDAAIDALFSFVKEHQFEPIRRVREVNVKFWPRFEQRIEVSQRARDSARFAEQTFPYFPALAEMYKAADRVMQQARDAAPLEAAQSLMNEVTISVIPRLMEVDGAYAASHEALKFWMDQEAAMRQQLLSEEPREDEAFASAARTFEDKLPALRQRVERLRKRFEDIAR